MSARVLSFFICRVVNDTNYLVADFSEQCGSDQWFRFLPLAVVCLVLYPIGIPLCLFVALYRVRKQHHVPKVQIALGILFEAFAKHLVGFSRHCPQHFVALCCAHVCCGCVRLCFLFRKKVVV